MGRRGPAPKSSAQKGLEGDPGRRGTNPQEPIPDPGARCPQWLGKVARREWRRLAPVLKNCGILSKADRDCLAAYCDALANYIRLTQEIENLPVSELTVRTAQTQKINPIIIAQRNYAELMIKYGGRLGLSPSDRTGIKANKQQPQSKWAGKLTAVK